MQAIGIHALCLSASLAIHKQAFATFQALQGHTGSSSSSRNSADEIREREGSGSSTYAEEASAGGRRGTSNRAEADRLRVPCRWVWWGKKPVGTGEIMGGMKGQEGRGETGTPGRSSEVCGFGGSSQQQHQQQQEEQQEEQQQQQQQQQRLVRELLESASLNKEVRIE